MERSGASGGLSAGTLKAIAILAMTLDHLAWAFVPRLSPAGMALHLVGRITAPIMCFFLAEGFVRTRSVGKYALRLGSFALISQVPYALFSSGRLAYGSLSMIFTLFLSLLALWAWESSLPRPLRLAAVFCLALVSSVGDWGIYALLFTFAFHLNRGNFPAQFRAMALWAGVLVVLMAANCAFRMPPWDVLRTVLPQMGVLLSLPLLACYRGARGRGGPAAKWFFYGYYPAHLLVIWLIKAAALAPGAGYFLM